MILYHITKEEHLNDIYFDGLKINSNKIGFCRKTVHNDYKKMYNMQPIFLTDDVEYIIKNMLTDNWIKKNKAVVLKINIELNNTTSLNFGYFLYDKYNHKYIPKEYRIFNDILPNNIEFFKKLY